jgi:hypothetical protein
MFDFLLGKVPMDPQAEQGYRLFNISPVYMMPTGLEDVMLFENRCFYLT